MHIVSINLTRGVVHTDRGYLRIGSMLDCIGEETADPEQAAQVILRVPEFVCIFPSGQWLRIDLTLFKLPTLH